MSNLSKIVLFAVAFCFILIIILRLVFRQDKPDPLYSYKESQEHFYNPLIGFAPQSAYEDIIGKNTLVYIDVHWRDFEPEEGVYDFEAIEKYSHVSKWRGEGKHAVLRFICDTPKEKESMDIPDWLYEKIEGDGYHYDKEGQRGFSPQYNNEIFIEYHDKAIRKLAEFFNKDTFLSYVQLGSLGH